MHPYCCKCFCTDPEPVETDGGDTVYWFKIESNGSSEEEELYTVGIDENGEVDYMFLGVLDKDFEYDESFKIMCPDCVVGAVGEDDGALLDENLESFDEVEGEDIILGSSEYEDSSEDEDYGGYFLLGLN